MIDSDKESRDKASEILQLLVAMIPTELDDHPKHKTEMHVGYCPVCENGRGFGATPAKARRSVMRHMIDRHIQQTEEQKKDSENAKTLVATRTKDGRWKLHCPVVGCWTMRFGINKKDAEGRIKMHVSDKHLNSDPESKEK